MKTATTSRIGLLLILLLIGATMTLGLGIRPAKTTIESEFEKKYEGEIWVVNSDYQAGTLRVYVEGEMAKYVKVKEEEIIFREDDDAKAIYFSLHLPEKIPAGESTANIIIEQDTSLESGSVGSKIVLKHKIVINGPYPEKYVKAKVNFHEREDSIEFVSEINNVGTKKIDNVYTKFYVNDKQQQTQTFTTSQQSLDTHQNTLLETKIDKDLFEKGEFEVSAITYYDDQQVEVIKKLIVGKPEVEITYFDKYLKANTINEYTLELLNTWNRNIENVYVDVFFKKDNQLLETFRTKPIDLAALMRERIKDYFDVRAHGPGTYSIELQVNFWNSYKMDIVKYEVELLKPEEIEKISQPVENMIVGKAIQNDQTSSKSNIIIALLVLILIAIVSLGGYILHRYKNKDDYEGGNNAF